MERMVTIGIGNRVWSTEYDINVNSRGSISALHSPYILMKQIYLFMVNGKFYLHIHEALYIVAPVRQYLAEQMEKKGFSIVISL
jgi:hypothetical protein